MSRFQRATRAQKKLRLAIDGPSGSGKTYTALALARELAGENGRIAVIDTERASASLYANQVAEFDALDLTNHSPESYIEAIADAARAGYAVLVIDSFSHAWSGRGGALEMVDNAAKRSSSGNSFTAWRDVTPWHNKLVDAVLSYPGHVIATMRSKTEYVLQEITKNGRTIKEPKKIGMAPIQRDGVEYEFDVVGSMDLDHNLVVGKTRCAVLDGAVVKKPGAEMAATLREWLEAGEAPAPPPATAAPAPATNGQAAAPAPAAPKDPRVQAFRYHMAYCAEIGFDTANDESHRELLAHLLEREVVSRKDLTAEDWNRATNLLKTRNEPPADAPVGAPTEVAS